jgi:hypothetical protein
MGTKFPRKTKFLEVCGKHDALMNSDFYIVFDGFAECDVHDGLDYRKVCSVSEKL